ncbi:hypothetical protein KEM56_006256 [Ascosphaera pollenicola]|nr:hypothetical protein KEM56_006256 [Ascosphaera pollenicola]
MATIDDGILAASLIPPSHGPPGLLTLPLNLVSEVLAYVDDARDLASLCCSCRVLNYMALPQLYKNFTLTSYDTIRFRNDQPEGCGSASPFSMGLNSIVARNLGPLVRTFTLRGTWLEHELEEHSRMGRVPESSMMLNIVVRAAVDKMSNLESFVWQLSTKALETVYQGLSQLRHLKSLTIRFPSSRHPRPTTVIPPMTNLECLKITHIDPLCYPDDISILLARSENLKDLRLHWSPRMKQSQEASVRLSEYFRKCVSLNHQLQLKRVSFQNFYAPYEDELERALDHASIEELHLLNSARIFTQDYVPISFVETSWSIPCVPMNLLKCFRHDQLDKKLMWFISGFTALERLYYISPIRTLSDYINRAREPSSSHQSDHPEYPTDERLVSLFDDPPPKFNHATPPAVINAHIALQDAYLKTIFNTHGSRLKHLLLPSRWTISKAVLVRLVKACPNLEQLGFAAEISSLDTVFIVQHYLPKLRALRLLIPTTRYYGIPTPVSGACSPSDKPMKGSGQDENELYSTAQQQNDAVISQVIDLNARAIAELTDLDDRLHIHALGLRLGDMPVDSPLRIISIGWKAFQIGETYTISASQVFPKLNESGAEVDNATPHMREQDTINHDIIDITGSQSIRPSSRSEALTQPAPSSKRKAESYFPQSPRPCRKIKTNEASGQSNVDACSAFDIMNMTIPLSPPSEEANAENEELPLFDISDLSAYVTSTGHPLSETGKAEASRFLSRLQLLEARGGPIPKKKVRRVGWDVLRHWEIFAMDTQEI